MRIILDAMGSDAHPVIEIQAALAAVERWGDPIILTGPEDLLNSQLKNEGGAPDPDLVTVVHAPEVLEMTDKPAEAARAKPGNSMAVGMRLVKRGEADAFVTAGNTGGALANALFTLGRIRGVKRPMLAVNIPVRGGFCVALDIGANADCKPEYILQFAILGAVYAGFHLGVDRARVGLLSNGEEPGKGNALVKESYPLLQASDLNFIGNVEPKEVYGGEVDVVVMDGFDGNVFVKTSEAVADFLVEIIRREIEAGFVTSLGGMLARPAFRRVRRLLDPTEYGAAPLLGVDGLVLVGHGRSDTKALVNAIRVAREAVEAGLLETMRRVIQSSLDKQPVEEIG
jgi:glycerol-3-phosphate acyltransferase PlsX